MTTKKKIEMFFDNVVTNPYPYEIKVGVDNNSYVVFNDQDGANYWEFFFHDKLNLSRVCFGKYDNAFGPIKEN